MDFNISTPQLLKLIYSVTALFLLLAARYLILSQVEKKDYAQLYRWKKNTAYALSFFLLIVPGVIWIEGVRYLSTYFGLLSAGIAIAMRDLITNFAGWLFIIWRKPFTVGDRIQIGDQSGDVIDVRIFQFSVMEIGNRVEHEQSTGRIIHIPNQFVFQKPQANYTLGFNYIWNEIPVLITFESDWQKAKKILTDITENHAVNLTAKAEKEIKESAKKFMIKLPILKPIVYTSTRESGILLTIRYLCEPRNRRGSAHVIWEEILTEFSHHTDIDFAYPTTRFYDNPTEGKRKTDKVN